MLIAIIQMNEYYKRMRLRINKHRLGSTITACLAFMTFSALVIFTDDGLVWF